MTVENPLVHGKKTAEAREIAAEELRKRGLIEKEEEISQNVATAERTGGIIEPLPKLQWFIAVNKPFGKEQKTLKELMKTAVTDGGIKILPERFEKIYFNWIDNLRDWCISRQIWFGHQIPVWYCMHCGEPQVNAEITSKWFIMRHGQTDWNKEERYMGQPRDPDKRHRTGTSANRRRNVGKSKYRRHHFVRSFAMQRDRHYYWEKGRCHANVR